METLTIWLSNPFVLLMAGGMLTYLANKAMNRAQAKKVTVEGVVLGVDKVVELSGTIVLLHQTIIDKEKAEAVLVRQLGACQEDCGEIKTYIKEFLGATKEIHQGITDAMIQRQLASLERKIVE